jgi:hypothetical protein
MIKLRLAVGVFLFVGLFTSASLAQTGANARTFVSGQGVDSNLCSVTAPCRTFARALTQTAPGGEVVVLTSAGYGPFTISHAVTIEAPAGIYAGITVASGDGIDIDDVQAAGPSNVVVLRGLTIVGQGTTGYGIDASIIGTLHVENCVVSGFEGGQGPSSGFGLGVFGFGSVLVKDSIFRNNAAGIGITSASSVTIDHVRMEGNFFGLLAEGGSRVSVNDSDASGNEQGITADTGSVVNLVRCVASNNNIGIYSVNNQDGGPQTVVIVETCLLSGNVVYAIDVGLSPGVVEVTVSDTSITGNGTGLANGNSDASLSAIFSFGNNKLAANPHDGSFTQTIKLQ